MGKSIAALTVLMLLGALCAADDGLRAGFAAVEITPELNSPRPVYMAGYGMNRKAKGVHDPLYARAVVLAHGSEKIAIVSVDLVGLQYPAVQAIRRKLDGFRYVLISSTHNHEGPDVIGIWGRGPFFRGVDDSYLDGVVDLVASCIKKAAEALKTVEACYGTAEDESLLKDSRLPLVKDGVLRVVRLNERIGGQTAGLLVQWNCHPESLGPKNTLLTADFPWATVAALEKKYRCPVVYLSGAVGGLMSLPEERISNASGKKLKDGNFEYAELYGQEVASLASTAIENATPLKLIPFAVATKPIIVPVHNALYRLARTAGVIRREGVIWIESGEKRGEPNANDAGNSQSAIESEVAYVRLGELHVACIPGELYPELVYGKYEDPAAPGADFPDAPLEPTVSALMPGPKWLLIGLANDELGYIIPKRQWDKAPPYAYDKDGGQYGEVNSCSAEVAPIVMEALRGRVAEIAPPTPATAQ
jgi:hypothetical protein